MYWWVTPQPSATTARSGRRSRGGHTGGSRAPPAATGEHDEQDDRRQLDARRHAEHDPAARAVAGQVIREGHGQQEEDDQVHLAVPEVVGGGREGERDDDADARPRPGRGKERPRGDHSPGDERAEQQPQPRDLLPSRRQEVERAQEHRGERRVDEPRHHDRAAVEGGVGAGARRHRMRRLRVGGEVLELAGEMAEERHQDERVGGGKARHDRGGRDHQGQHPPVPRRSLRPRRGSAPRHHRHAGECRGWGGHRSRAGARPLPRRDRSVRRRRGASARLPSRAQVRAASRRSSLQP